jgi:glycosyltransferase involved in cell wall biosynthesis
MKILHLSTYSRGGAAKACIRLHESLVKSGSDSSILFLYRGDTAVEQAYSFSVPLSRRERWIKRIKKKFFPKTTSARPIQTQIKSFVPGKIEWFSFPETGIDITKNALYKEADIIHLHWVADFLDYSFFKKNKKPVIWTLHDMNPFTGGCHYDEGSNGYEKMCLNCPQLQDTINPDYAAHILEIKRKAIQFVNNLTIVTPSQWLGEASRRSMLFNTLKHVVIPYGLDSHTYHPADKIISRKALGLPLDKKIILFVSDALDTRRKGFTYLLQALQMLKNKEEFILCTLGASKSGQGYNTGFMVKELGYLHEEEMICKAYSAANVFIIPSLMDNFPNTVLESIMCGTPVVGFPVGGIRDMVQNDKNGLLCTEKTSESLADTIQNFFDNMPAFDRVTIRKDAVERYDLNVQLKAYKSLYQEIINS